MATEESTWQITYLDYSESELLLRDVWIGRFLVVWDDGREQQVKVELSEELVTNIESKWPEIDADPESLIRTLGGKKIDTQLQQQGRVEKVVRLYSKQYPGYPGRPDA